jgi:hypothetical protein
MSLTKREEIVFLAQSEIAKTDSQEYFREAMGFIPVNYKSISWCGLFTLTILRRAQVTDWTWRVGLGFLFRLPTTKDPQPGDLVYFDKPYQHHALCEEIKDDGIWIIAGNCPNVARSFIEKNKPTAYYSIEPLLQKLQKDNKEE